MPAGSRVPGDKMGSAPSASPGGGTGPVKHSITIAGHETSISLEPVFWEALRRAAGEEGVAVNALVARVDEERLASLARASGEGRKVQAPANLASALRTWLWKRYCE